MIFVERKCWIFFYKTTAFFPLLDKMHSARIIKWTYMKFWKMFKKTSIMHSFSVKVEDLQSTVLLKKLFQ